MFTGHDCSVNLAKMEFGKEYLNKYNKVELTESELQTLDEWYDSYNKKYKKVGSIKS